MRISGEQVFPVNTKQFAISPSTEGYTLYYSADGVGWTAYEDAVPAGEVCIVNFGVPGMSYKLVGNVGDVFIQY